MTLQMLAKRPYWCTLRDALVTEVNFHSNKFLDFNDNQLELVASFIGEIRNKITTLYFRHDFHSFKLHLYF